MVVGFPQVGETPLHITTPRYDALTTVVKSWASSRSSTILGDNGSACLPGSRAKQRREWAFAQRNYLPWVRSLPAPAAPARAASGICHGMDLPLKVLPTARSCGARAHLLRASFITAYGGVITAASFVCVWSAHRPKASVVADATIALSGGFAPTSSQPEEEKFEN